MIRTRYRLSIGLSSTTAEANDLGAPLYQAVEMADDEGGVTRIDIPKLTTDLEILFPYTTTARLIALQIFAKDETRTPVPISVKINSAGADPITVQALDTTPEGFLAWTGNAVTSLFVSNADATTDMKMTITSSGQ